MDTRLFKQRLASFCVVISGFAFLYAYDDGDIEKVFYLPEECECVSLITSDSLSENIQYKIKDFAGHPTIVTGNNLVLLDDSLSEIVPLPFEAEIIDIHWKDGECFFSADSALYYGERNGEIHPLVYSDDEIPSFDVADSGIFFALDSLLAFYSYETLEVECICKAQSPLSHIEADGNACFFSAGKDLFIKDDSMLYRIFSADDDIQTFVVDPEGIVFYSTSKGVFYLDPQYRMFPIIEKPAKDLSLISETLYIIFMDNSSVAITNITKMID